MAKYKIRRPLIVKSGMNVGVDGTLVKEILAGSVQFDVGAITASGGNASTTATISNLDAGAQILLQAKDALSGVVLYSACTATANTVGASFASATGSAVAAASIVYSYIAFVEG